MVPEKDIVTIDELHAQFSKLQEPDAEEIHKWDWYRAIKHWLYNHPEHKWVDQDELAAMAIVKAGNQTKIEQAIRRLEADGMLNYAMTNRKRDDRTYPTRLVKLEYAERQKYRRTLEQAVKHKSQRTVIQSAQNVDVSRNVLVIHGRNTAARQAMFDFLRARIKSAGVGGGRENDEDRNTLCRSDLGRGIPECTSSHRIGNRR
jgi:hypothetical protein